MNRQPITTRTRLADALACSPHAPELFRRHGFDPTLYCGPSAQVLTLGEAVAGCGLPHTQQLIAELNAELDVATTPIGTLVERCPGVEVVLEDFGFDACCTVEFTPLEIAEKAAIEPGPLVAALRQVTER